MEKTVFLPEYTVRRSKRARRIGLRVLPSRGLEVVLPYGADPACVPELIMRHRVWIERAVARMGAQVGGHPVSLPRFFFIKGGAEKIIVKDPTGRNSVFGESGGETEQAQGESVERTLLLPSVATREGARPGMGLSWLRAWVRREAGVYLIPWLEDLARRHSLAYTGAGIRMQRTRWGSCSAKGRLNLNASLLFLPPELTRYILLHELCHTREMNHKEGFWQLLFALEPNALALDQRMRRAWRYVPAWVTD